MNRAVRPLPTDTLERTIVLQQTPELMWGELRMVEGYADLLPRPNPDESEYLARMMSRQECLPIALTGAIDGHAGFDLPADLPGGQHSVDVDG